MTMNTAPIPTPDGLARARVAVIGAGPAGLVAAKELLEQGFEPVVLEQSGDIGGQWHATAAHSGVWPGMRANTSRTTTAFSDLPMPSSVAMFPRAEDVHGYLRAYASRFGVHERVRTGARVVEVARAAEGWTVRWTEYGAERRERFAAVVVASGRFGRPRFPAVRGLTRPVADQRVLHAFDYRGRDEFRGKRVLVYGNSISGLEIASDLAADHTITVTSACRRPRYVIQKVVRGLPTDWRYFNRLAALLGAALPPEAVAAGMRQAVLAEAGDPARYGGLAVDPQSPPALSQSQEYLAHVAEGRIAVRPGVESAEGETVRFADGSQTDVDVVICATGYDLHLPYLADDVRTVLRPDDTHLDLHARTFHPDLPGLAFLGQFALVGPYLPILELQARWAAGVWSGALPGPSRQQMRAGISAHRAMRALMPVDIYHALAGLLAGELGVEPDPAAWPQHSQGLLFGPLAPARYRLQGPGAQPGAEARFRVALAELGPLPPVPAEQLNALAMVADALKDPALAAIADRLGAPATRTYASPTSTARSGSTATRSASA
jgi:cation diffusion facilitator CzcD-associated flavoprotein CzcO